MVFLNINRPAVLRQYFGKEIIPTSANEKHIHHYNYVSGSETSSVGMDPRHFITRRLNPSMEYTTNESHKIFFLYSTHYL